MRLFAFQTGREREAKVRQRGAARHTRDGLFYLSRLFAKRACRRAQKAVCPTSFARLPVRSSPRDLIVDTFRHVRCRYRVLPDGRRVVIHHEKARSAMSDVYVERADGKSATIRRSLQQHRFSPPLQMISPRCSATRKLRRATIMYRLRHQPPIYHEWSASTRTPRLPLFAFTRDDPPRKSRSPAPLCSQPATAATDAASQPPPPFDTHRLPRLLHRAPATRSRDARRRAPPFIARPPDAEAHPSCRPHIEPARHA